MNPSSHIGQYRIVRKIGVGGMGTVFLGEHVLLKRRAAIKTLLPSLSVHPEIVERFFNEARATSAIVDPGVVQIFDFGYHVDGTAFIVMELLEGESLAARIERLGTLPVVDALRIARQIAGSLAAAHGHDIVHRDLKPENIFLIHDPELGERTKILDFGVCKVGDRDADLTQTDTMLGTPVYMAPEQCRGAGRADHRSDLYTLGGVLFHMIAGRPPFECDGVGEFMAAHLREQPPAASTLVPMLPASVDELIARCLAKDPADRFQSMAELRLAIEQALAGISDSGIVIPAARAAVPLPAGFKSEYDASVGIAIPGGTPPPSPTTTPATRRGRLSPVPHTHRVATPVPQSDVLPNLSQDLSLDDLEVVSVRRPWRSMIAILAVAAVVAVAGAQLAMEPGDDAGSAAAASVEPAPAPAPVVDQPAAPLPELLRAEPEQSGAAPSPQPVVEPIIVPEPPPQTAARERTVAKPQPKARRASPSPTPSTTPRPAPGAIPSPAAPPTPAPASAPTEDLYDTR